MKVIHLLLAYFFALSISAAACPTCIGRLDHKSPPFFTKEYEQYHQEKERIAQELHDADNDEEDDVSAKFNQLLKEET